MAEDESKSSDDSDSAEGKAVHQSLIQRFKDEPKWVKIGSLAGVAVLGITILLYFKNSSQASAAGATTTGDTTNGQGASTEMPGEGDIYPSLPAATGISTPGSTGASSSPASTGSSPSKIKATPIKGSAPVATGGLLSGGSPPRAPAKPKTYALNSAVPGKVNKSTLKQIQAQKMLSGVPRNIGGGPSRRAAAMPGLSGSFWRI